MIRRNIFANLLGRVWGVTAVYLFIPLYIKLLGIEAYGLIGFYSALLGVVTFTDLGLTATLNRELARLSVRADGPREMRNLLRTYEYTYVGISVIIVVTVWFLAPVLGAHWLRTTTLLPGTTTNAIRVMGIAMALQLPSGLLNGGLMGLQRQVLANALQIAWGMLRGFGAVLILWRVSRTVHAFFVWQVFANFSYFALERFFLWRVLPKAAEPGRFEWSVFRSTWRFSFGMMGLMILSTVLQQADKLVVSKVALLQDFGYYTIAYALAQAPVSLSGPIANAVYPRMTALAALEDRDELNALYHRTCAIVSVFAITGGLTLTVFAGQFIYSWTGSLMIARKASLVCSLLLAGQVLQALTSVPYTVVLARGRVGLNIKIALASVIIVVPLLVVLVPRYGIVGAGVSWLVMNIVTFPLYMYLVHSELLPGQLRQWILRDIGLPLLASTPCILAGRWLLFSSSSRIGSLIFMGLVWAVAAAVSTLFVGTLRTMMREGALRLAGVDNGR